MSDYEETRQTGSESGLYRKLKSWLFPAAVVVLWAILSGLSVTMYVDVKSNSAEIARLKTLRESDREGNQEFQVRMSQEMKEIKSDIKELLRETRK